MELTDECNDCHIKLRRLVLDLIELSSKHRGLPLVKENVLELVNDNEL